MVENIDPHPVHPTYKAKFKSGTAQTLIRDILKRRLQDEVYNQDTAPTLTREIADQIKNELRKMGLARYKFLVQVVIGEQRGAGVRMATRCFWDPQSDGFSTDTFINDTLFCTATAWALYLY